ncbi:rhamnan synthesis F family protein [Leptothrix ochracea]|uniref:rhamnan synthesis F family protein n=1 Tax=Leptothrix ochracea TaxID=735331 RepID=UPI0034E256AD
MQNSGYFKFRAFLWHLKQKLPYVRRREYAVMAQRYEQALLAFMAKPSMATDAGFTVVHQRADVVGEATSAGRDLCLFVSYAPQPTVKAHVLHHIQAFRQEGFEVILILNSPHAAETFTLDPALVAACEAICVRENTGLDFAAWAHAVDHFKLGTVELDRVVLANDSIIGPVSQPAFKALVDRVRASKSDVIGLTENWAPRWHLQSFFLVFQREALQRGLFAQAMASIQNLPNKDLVIDVYETHFTLAMKAQGLRCEALFEADPHNLYKANSIYYRWASLMERGFPYLKVSVLAEGQHNPAVRAALPAEMLQAWEREQVKPK